MVEGREIFLDDDEPEGPNPVAVAVTAQTTSPSADGARMLEARLVVLGDADFSSNESINFVFNQSLLLNSIAWLSENEELIAKMPSFPNAMSCISTCPVW